VKAAFGTVENVRKVPSRHVVQVIIELPIESYVAAVTLLDGQKALVTVSGLEIPFGIVDSQEPPEDKPEPVKAEQKPKMGPLCSWAVMRCQEPEFQEFMRQLRCGDGGVACEESAKSYICAMMGVESRKDFDANKSIALSFQKLIMEPWSKSPLNPHRQAA
jgi:hypothetical protein